eukprot:TRINITY_DN36441_c0_g2_i2.p1 TRINITY_DN36441_c0_g2~~TRINITY_DN36441_c0_g2_i2.p1  ORF type:complete len:2454 (-),score=489.74 TRINITY_DN36441_c0_g2_i2:43-7074(-)
MPLEAAVQLAEALIIQPLNSIHSGWIEATAPHLQRHGSVSHLYALALRLQELRPWAEDLAGRLATPCASTPLAMRPMIAASALPDAPASAAARSSAGAEHTAGAGSRPLPTTDAAPVLDAAVPGPADSQDKEAEPDRPAVDDITSGLAAEADVPPTADENASEQHAVVEALRCRDFGADGAGMMGRALDKLSKDLYDRAFHFIFELVQNCDDNHYSTDAHPTALFILSNMSIVVLNNERGFNAKNVQAISDVGASTKPMSRGAQLIGRKGIGFKAVFSVSDRPAIVSNGFQIEFDSTTGPLGMITPKWLPRQRVPAIRPCYGAVGDAECPEEVEDSDDEAEKVSYGGPDQGTAATKAHWTTMIHLPFGRHLDESHLRRCSKEMQDLQPILLLFLNRLRRLYIADELAGKQRTFERIDEVQSSHVQADEKPGTTLQSNVISRRINLSLRETTVDDAVSIEKGVHGSSGDVEVEPWLLLSRPLQAPAAVAKMAPPGTRQADGTAETVIQVAISLTGAQRSSRRFPVCAYLPVCHAGFHFVLQGNWNLTAARNRVHDDSWNQYLRSEFPELLVEAFRNLRVLSQQAESPISIDYVLSLLPAEDAELDAWYRPIAHDLFQRLRTEQCIPVTGSEWRLPGNCVFVPAHIEPLLSALLEPAELYEVTGLSFVHPSVARLLEARPGLAARLGIRPLPPAQLLDILEAFEQRGVLQMRSLDWLSTLYRLLYTVFDTSASSAMKGSAEGSAGGINTKLENRLAALSIVPVAGGRRLRARDCSGLLLPVAAAHSVVMGADASPAQRYAFEDDLFVQVDAAFLSESQEAYRPVLLAVLARLGARKGNTALYMERIANALKAFTSDSTLVLTPAKVRVLVSYMEYLFDNAAGSKARSPAFKVIEDKCPLICYMEKAAKEAHPELFGNLIQLDTTEYKWALSPSCADPSSMVVVLCSPSSCSKEVVINFDPAYGGVDLIHAFGLGGGVTAAVPFVIVSPCYLQHPGRPHPEHGHTEVCDSKWRTILSSMGVRNLFHQDLPARLPCKEVWWWERAREELQGYLPEGCSDSDIVIEEPKVPARLLALLASIAPALWPSGTSVQKLLIRQPTGGHIKASPEELVKILRLCMLLSFYIADEVQPRLVAKIIVKPSNDDEDDLLALGSAAQSNVVATVPSGFVRFLKELAWVPDESCSLRQPGNLFLATEENRSVFGEHVPYVHSGGQPVVAANFTCLELFGNCTAPTASNILQQMMTWRKMSPFRTSLGHMTAVYNFFEIHCRKKKGATEAEVWPAFLADAAVWVPRHRGVTKQSPAFQEKAVDGDFVAVRLAPLRTAPCEVNGKTLKSVIADKAGSRIRFLECHYEVELKDFFTSLGCPKQPSAIGMLEVLSAMTNSSGRDGAGIRDVRELCLKFLRDVAKQAAAQEDTYGAEDGGGRRLDQEDLQMLRQSEVWPAHDGTTCAPAFAELYVDDCLRFAGGEPPRLRVAAPTHVDGKRFALLGGGLSHGVREMFEATDEDLLPLARLLQLPYLSKHVIVDVRCPAGPQWSVVMRALLRLTLHFVQRFIVRYADIAVQLTAARNMLSSGLSEEACVIICSNDILNLKLSPAVSDPPATAEWSATSFLRRRDVGPAVLYFSIHGGLDAAAAQLCRQVVSVLEVQQLRGMSSFIDMIVPHLQQSIQPALQQPELIAVVGAAAFKVCDVVARNRCQLSTIEELAQSILEEEGPWALNDPAAVRFMPWAAEVPRDLQTWKQFMGNVQAVDETLAAPRLLQQPPGLAHPEADGGEESDSSVEVPGEAEEATATHLHEGPSGAPSAQRTHEVEEAWGGGRSWGRSLRKTPGLGSSGQDGDEEVESSYQPLPPTGGQTYGSGKRAMQYGSAPDLFTERSPRGDGLIAFPSHLSGLGQPRQSRADDLEGDYPLSLDRSSLRRATSLPPRLGRSLPPDQFHHGAGRGQRHLPPLPSGLEGEDRSFRVSNPDALFGGAMSGNASSRRRLYDGLTLPQLEEDWADMMRHPQGVPPPARYVFDFDALMPDSGMLMPGLEALLESCVQDAQVPCDMEALRRFLLANQIFSTADLGHCLDGIWLEDWKAAGLTEELFDCLSNRAKGGRAGAGEDPAGESVQGPRKREASGAEDILSSLLLDRDADQVRRQKAIGRLGERWVFERLLALQRTDPASDHGVVWVNRETETGWPFDIVVGVRSMADLQAVQLGNLLQRGVAFIEVKSSTAGVDEKRAFEISFEELDLARRCGEQYAVWRVMFGSSMPAATAHGNLLDLAASLQDPVQVVKLTDPYQRLRNHTIKLLAVPLKNDNNGLIQREAQLDEDEARSGEHAQPPDDSEEHIPARRWQRPAVKFQ